MHKTKKHRRNERRPHSETSTKMFTLQQKSKDSDKPAQLQKGLSLTFLLSFIFSHHIPSPLCHSTSTVREKACLAATQRLLRQHPPNNQASCTSWHNIIHGHVTTQSHLCQLPILQEEREILPYNPMTCSAPSHTLFSRDASDETLSSFDHTSSSLFPHWTPLATVPPCCHN